MNCGFNANRIRKLGNNAFFWLNNLSMLVLTSNQLEYIPSNAFSFEKKSSNTLSLHLSFFLFDGSSFAVNSFTQFQRPTVIPLYGNTRLTYFHQDIFLPLFNGEREKI